MGLFNIFQFIFKQTLYSLKKNQNPNFDFSFSDNNQNNQIPLYEQNPPQNIKKRDNRKSLGLRLDFNNIENPNDKETKKNVKDVVVKTADAEIASANSDMKYQVGTMIEIPRAALTADDIAKEAEFFCFVFVG